MYFNIKNKHFFMIEQKSLYITKNNNFILKNKFLTIFIYDHSNYTYKGRLFYCLFYKKMNIKIVI